MRLPAPTLLLITDRQQARVPLEDIAAAAFAGGCRWLSLREKDLDPAARRALLARLVALGNARGALVMAHEDIDAVAMVGAGGVHLPSGASPAAARHRLGSAALIGLSAHGPDDIARALAEGADYVTLSPIFLSASKPGYGPALGLAALSAAAGGLPVLALGGIDENNAGDAVAAGAAGIAVMGRVMSAGDPATVMAALLQSLGAALAPRAVGGP